MIMQKVTLHLIRLYSNDTQEDLGEYHFCNGDFFNLYHGVVADSVLSGSSNFHPWFGFSVHINQNNVILTQLLPVSEGEATLHVGESITLDFQHVGRYTIKLISIQ